MLKTNRRGKLIDGVSATAAEASRTLSIPVLRAKTVRMTYSLARDGASTATHMTAQFYTSVDGGLTWGRVPSFSVAGGVGNASDYTVSNPVTGSESMDLVMNVEAATDFKVVFAITGGVAADLVTVSASTAEET
jgi:hypothetical protein